MNAAQKLISAHLVSGDLTPGGEIAIRIDQTLTQDSTGTMAYLQLEAMGTEQVKTKRSVAYIDHNMLQSGFENADDHKYIQTVAAKHGIWFSRPGNGICHQVHLERFSVPGQTLLGSDSHTPTCGAAGMLAIGAGGLDVAVAMGGGAYYLAMPKICKVELTGALRPMVTAKDVILEVLRRLSVKGGVGKIMEYSGEGLKTLSVPERATIANMGAELEIFLRNMPFAILISGNDGRIINVNAKFEEYFAAKEKNIVGKPYEEWKHVIQKSLCKTYGEGHFEIRLHGDGEERILELHEEPIFDVFRNRVGQFCFCRDVTIERTFEHQIWISANTDALTGLYNRRFFYEYMNENRKENQLSLLYVDLDDFKKVNDAHGHHIGDGALELVARLMREAFPGDFIVRLGGDEFLICLVGERSLAFLEEKANRLLQSLLGAFQASDYLRVMSASIGIASSADPGTKLDDLVRQSDIAMYAAKQSGKSRCCVYSSGLTKK